MYRVFNYKDKNGKEPVGDYLESLESLSGKSSRIKARKIRHDIDVLEKVGTWAGEPYVKHLQGEIWELRPLKDRILFAAWDSNSYILLHHFVKKTRKTPQGEIDRAKQYLKDYRERKEQNG